MTSDKNIYKGYSNARNWQKMFSPSKQVSALLDKEFKNVNLEGADLLDVGFGSGYLLAWAKNKGAQVAGVELQDDLLARATESGYNVFSNLNDVPTESIDIVVLFDIIEHIELNEIAIFLEQVMRILKPKGNVFIRFPNCQSQAGLVNQFGDYTHVSMLSGPIVEFHMKQVGFCDISYRAARGVTSSKFLNRTIKLFLKPFLKIFEYGYRLTFSDRTTILTANVFLQAKKN